MVGEVFPSNHLENCYTLARAGPQGGQPEPFDLRDSTRPCDSYFTPIEESVGQGPDPRRGTDAVAVVRSIGQSPGTRPLPIPLGYKGSDLNFNKDKKICHDEFKLYNQSKFDNPKTILFE